jgi:hypothetical protein
VDDDAAITKRLHLGGEPESVRAIAPEVERLDAERIARGGELVAVADEKREHPVE